MNENYKQIGIFTLDESNTTMLYGTYYQALMDVPFSQEKRAIRVWLPSDYDFENRDKKFPVIYFSDGQNLVNQYLTAFGDWHLDRVAQSLLESNNISFIAVGIDSPKDDSKRSNELNPPYIPDREKGMHPIGDQFVDFIGDTLKPIIDELFNTKKEKEYTGIGGSSMGGIMAFYGATRRKELFGFSLVFSPAFLLYKKKRWHELLEEFNISPDDKTKYFFYVGGKQFERLFIRLTKYTYNYLLSIGFDDSNTWFIYDKKMKHHEDAWSKYLGDAIRFWLETK